jgi:YHS domain-containing protein
MKTLGWFACCAVVLAFAAGGCGKKEPASGTTIGAVAVQKTCPVMGKEINKDIYRDYKGQRIYFCCPMCPPEFDKDPEKYVKIVDEELKAQKAATPKTK